MWSNVRFAKPCVRFDAHEMLKRVDHSIDSGTSALA